MRSYFYEFAIKLPDHEWYLISEFILNDLMDKFIDDIGRSNIDLIRDGIVVRRVEPQVLPRVNQR